MNTSAKNAAPMAAIYDWRLTTSFPCAPAVAAMILGIYSYCVFTVTEKNHAPRVKTLILSAEIGSICCMNIEKLPYYSIFLAKHFKKGTFFESVGY